MRSNAKQKKKEKTKEKISNAKLRQTVLVVTKMQSDIIAQRQATGLDFNMYSNGGVILYE